MYDLTHPIETGMGTYPGDPSVGIEPAATHEGEGYRVSQLRLGTHTGTHVDAPAHTEADGATLGDFDVSSFVRSCRLIDCRDLDARDPIPADRVPSIDSDDDCLVFRTGWAEHWGNERYLDHPYLSPAAAERCAEQGLAVGLDTLSPDPTPSDRAGTDEPSGIPAHHELLGSGSLVFENVRNLDSVGERFELRAFPLRIDGDGAPIRAIAVDPE